jgi:hypothetical protein
MNISKITDEWKSKSPFEKVKYVYFKGVEKRMFFEFNFN